MKKLFISVPLFLVVLMLLVFVFTACNGKDISAILKTVEEKADTNTPGLAAQDITTPTPTPTPLPTPTPSPTPAESTFRIGSVSDGVYTSDFIKIGCKLDKSWIFFNEEQIAEMNGIVQDSIDDEYLSTMLEIAAESGKIICDMSATSPSRGLSITVSFENLGVVYGMALDENKYIDLILDTAVVALESVGVTNVTSEKSSVDFVGASRSSIAITGELSGLPIYESVICIKNGNYMALVTLTSFNENTTEELASLFYSIE